MWYLNITELSRVRRNDKSKLSIQRIQPKHGNGFENARFKEDKKDRYIQDYELVFMPIIWARHFYVICFNLKHSKVDVLDNSVVEDDLSIEKKYAGWEEKLVGILKTLYVETMLT
ncbi:hypothetical protein HanIR_Chr17g0895761 [Helianthus annuus]|nr:hypothetical protein HanIR_Chr17g0895761 [Helianthus annuus]